MTGMSRRALLRSGAAVAVLAPIGAGVLGAGGTAEAATLSGLYRSRFTPAVGKNFWVHDGTKLTPLVLRAVNDLVPSKIARDEKRFSLRFQAGTVRPRSGTYRIWNASAGEVLLYIQRVDRTGGWYEAVVNRL
jgi:hypothetical protein